jgi:hypothetical protein
MPPRHLCQKHLLAEYREPHGLLNILTKHKGKGGYFRHPKTLRWAAGKQKAPCNRHEASVKKFSRKGYNTTLRWIKSLPQALETQNVFINSIAKQKAILKRSLANVY